MVAAVHPNRLGRFGVNRPYLNSAGRFCFCEIDLIGSGD
jgi:hypothetical protein